MNLYVYDSHHDRVMDKLSLGDHPPLKLLHEIIRFLERNNVTNDYKELVVAEGYEKTYDEEAGEYQVEFSRQEHP